MDAALNCVITCVCHIISSIGYTLICLIHFQPVIVNPCQHFFCGRYVPHLFSRHVRVNRLAPQLLYTVGPRECPAL